MINVEGIGYLRAPEISDLNALYALENEPDLWYLGYSKEPWSKVVLQRYLVNQPGSLLRDGQLRLILDHDGELIGAFDLYDYDPFARKAGVGLVLSPAHRGKGWSSLALKAFERYAFGTLGLNSLFAIVPSINIPSQSLFSSGSYKLVGELADWVMRDGKMEKALFYQKVLK